MTKAEALEHFRVNYGDAKSAAKINQLQEYYQAHREELAAGFIAAFGTICNTICKMQEQKAKDPIGYITFTLLRTNLLRGCHQYAVNAFNNEWFFDTQDCSGSYDVSWAYRFLDEFEAELDEPRKRYLDQVAKPDLEKIKLREIPAYHAIITDLARYAIPEAVKLPEYQRIVKDEVLEVRVEVYKQISEVVYKEDIRKKDPQETKSWMELKEDSYRDEILRGLDLSKGDYQGIELLYADLSSSDLSRSQLSDCELSEAKFRGSCLSEADLSYTRLDGTDFEAADMKKTVFFRTRGVKINFGNANLEAADLRECQIEESNFGNANLKAADLRSARMVECNFCGANLEAAILEGSDLSNSDLRNTRLEGATLREAYLENTRFSREAVAMLELDETQKVMIVIED